MSSSTQVLVLSLIATSLCWARPSNSQDEDRFLTVLSPGSSFDTLMSSLHQSSPSSSSVSASSETDRDSLSLPSSLWSDESHEQNNNKGDDKPSYLSGPMNYPMVPDSDVSPGDEVSGEVIPYDIQNGITVLAVEQLKNILRRLGRHQGSDANVIGDNDNSRRASKRFRPSGFMGSRGKRMFPGFESFLLARYYKDAAKWKRQPHLGFHGSRG